MRWGHTLLCLLSGRCHLRHEVAYCLVDGRIAVLNRDGALPA